MDQRPSGPAHRQGQGKTPASTDSQARPTDTPLGPYLRRLGDGAVPHGWVAEPVRGGWEGRETEIVYDPRRHEIAFTWQSRTRRRPPIDLAYDHSSGAVVLISGEDGDDAERDLTALGWQRRAVDGHRGFWTRDRSAATRAALERIDHAASPSASPRHQSHQRIAPKPPGGELTL